MIQSTAQGEARFSYEALLARSEQMAAALQAAGVAPGDKVGVMLARTPRPSSPSWRCCWRAPSMCPRSRAAAGAPGPYPAAGEVKTLITQAEYRHKLASLFEGRTLLAGIW